MQLDKATRGTKRMCPECNTRFYDLLRDSIPCPSCGVQFVATAQPAVEAVALRSNHAFNTGWRNKSNKRPEPVRQPDPEIASEAAADDRAIDSTTEETAGPEPDKDAVLEHELDDEDDLSHLVEHGDNEDKEH